MGSRDFKNVLNLREKSFGGERRQNLTKEELKNSSPFPSPVTYKDIDQEFHRWVEKDLSIAFEGKEIPTMDLFSNQRFTEYMQSWADVDEKKNLLMNFKAITRENNPKTGTINGQSKNIPGARNYLMKRVHARDKNDRPYFVEYRMKQPFAVDLNYKVTLVTNKYELINEFNQLINDKFKAINCYIRPEGHYMAMRLNDIVDDSEYSIDDREFYSQSYSITVMGYIITEDSFTVEERPMINFRGFEGEEGQTFVEIEEAPMDCPENPYEYQKVIITVSIDVCEDKVKFVMDAPFQLEKIEMNDTISSFRLFINDEEIEAREGLRFNEGDEVKINHLKRRRGSEPSVITFIGINREVVVSKDDFIGEGKKESVTLPTESY